MNTVFLRVIAAEDKSAALLEAVHEEGAANDRRRFAVETEEKEQALRAAIREPHAALGRQRFVVDPASFSAVPRSPFAYWVSDRLRRRFADLPALEAKGQTAKQGLATGDDFRFVRAWWEVLPKRLRTGWYSFAKGGKYSPFYADLQLIVNWTTDGAEIRNLKDAEKDRISSRPQNIEFYTRAGLTWPRRTTSELSLRAMPEGCIFADKGPAVFVAHDNSAILLSLLTVASSKAFRSFVELQLAAADAAARSYEVGVLQRTPLPNLTEADRMRLGEFGTQAWSLRRQLESRAETSHAFTVPALLQFDDVDLVTRADAWNEHLRVTESELSKIQSEIDELCFAAYEIDVADREAMEMGFGVDDCSVSGEGATRARLQDEGEEDDVISSPTELVAELLSWCLGVGFGRFDVRLARANQPSSNQHGPFDPLPVCSPGMLVGEDNLPAPRPCDGYPLSFPEKGVLVDDRGHEDDLVAAGRFVFGQVFGRSADSWWNEIAESLDSKDHDFRNWLRKDFFDYHLKLYSKSRRKAPIYWQLATPSAQYSVWLYAHRLTRDSFFQIQNDVATPKLAHEERKHASMVQDAGGSPNAKERKEIAAQESFVEELRAMLEEVKRVAPLWNPNLDDGVVLTMAPLWRLVPQHKSWQKELRSRWDELCAGKYDWAHIAMHLWPERVVTQCAKDRSLAIAHGLEDVFWAERDDGKWAARPEPTQPVDELVKERTSSAVKAALASLLEAPVPSASGRGRRKGGRAASARGNR